MHAEAEALRDAHASGHSFSRASEVAFAIQRFNRDGRWREALACFEEVRRQQPHLILDMSVLQVALDACRHGGQWETTLQVLQVVDALGKEPTDDMCGAAIASFGVDVAQWGRAMEVFSRQRQPGPLAYGAAIQVCHRAQQWQAAYDLHSRASAARVALDVAAYNQVADACASAQAWEKAMLVLLDMCSHGPPPNGRTHAVLDSLPWSTPGREVYAAVPRPEGAVALERVAATSSSTASTNVSRARDAPGTDPSPLSNAPASEVHPSSGVDARSSSPPQSQVLAPEAQEEPIYDRQRQEPHRRRAEDRYEDSVAVRPGGQEVTPDAPPPEEDDQPLSYRVLPSGDAIIDLHGLPVEVAKIAVQVAIEDLILGGGPGSAKAGPQKLRDLIIITGIGNNSPGKIALVRPAIIQFLQEQLRIQVLQTRRDGPGRLRVPASELLRLCGG